MFNARGKEVICNHTDRKNVLSLPSMGNPHCCAECLGSLKTIPHRPTFSEDLANDPNRYYPYSVAHVEGAWGPIWKK